MLPPGWQGVFRGIAITAGVVLFLSLLFLLRTGRYFGPIVERIYARTQWRWAGGRTVRAISAVEDLFLKLARTDSRRIADARAAQHRVLLADGVRGLPRVLGDRPADLAVGRHHRRDLHAIGERRRRRDPRQPRRARSVERRGGQGARPGRRRHARAVPAVPQPAVRDAGPGALSARQRSRPPPAPPPASTS